MRGGGPNIRVLPSEKLQKFITPPLYSARKSNRKKLNKLNFCHFSVILHFLRQKRMKMPKKGNLLFFKIKKTLFKEEFVTYAISEFCPPTPILFCTD